MITLSVIIVTKDRPAQVVLLLQNLGRQSRTPEEVVIVDDGELDAATLDSVAAEAGLTLKYFKKDVSGVVASRQRGVREASGDVVLFLDDDVVLDEGYIAAIMDVYEQFTVDKIGGVGGVIMRGMHSAKKAFLIFFALESYKQGGILPNGLGTLITHIDRLTMVDWLSGCNMSFPRRVFDEFSFDDVFGGNGWGDDRDFSFRVGKKYPLFAAPDARLIHLETPSGRVDARRFGMMETYHTRVFFKKNMPQRFLNKAALWWALAGIITKNILRLNPTQVVGNIEGIRKK